MHVPSAAASPQTLNPCLDVFCHPDLFWFTPNTRVHRSNNIERVDLEHNEFLLGHAFVGYGNTREHGPVLTDLDKNSLVGCKRVSIEYRITVKQVSTAHSSNIATYRLWVSIAPLLNLTGTE